MDYQLFKEDIEKPTISDTTVKQYFKSRQYATFQAENLLDSNTEKKAQHLILFCKLLYVFLTIQIETVHSKKS